MGLSLTEVKDIQEEFNQKYCSHNAYQAYINGCGISRLEVMQHLQQKMLDLKHGESLEDLCLLVNLRRKPPINLEFPSEYKEVRIFYTVVGEREIRAL